MCIRVRSVQCVCVCVYMCLSVLCVCVCLVQRVCVCVCTPHGAWPDTGMVVWAAKQVARGWLGAVPAVPAVPCSLHSHRLLLIRKQNKKLSSWSAALRPRFFSPFGPSLRGTCPRDTLASTAFCPRSPAASPAACGSSSRNPQASAQAGASNRPRGSRAHGRRRNSASRWAGGARSMPGTLPQHGARLAGGYGLRGESAGWSWGQSQGVGRTHSSGGFGNRRSPAPPGARGPAFPAPGSSSILRTSHGGRALCASLTHPPLHCRGHLW